MFGAIIGDYVGSKYEFNNIKTKQFGLFTKENTFTDDSVLTAACADWIISSKTHSIEEATHYLRKWARKYPYAGYGNRFSGWMYSDNPQPYKSYGNGAAMRISPVGWFAETTEEVIKLAKAFTSSTHNHDEGIKGAIVTAMCIYYARNGHSKEFIKDYVKNYYELDFDYDELKKTYEHGEEICQNTVPQAIYCFLISNSFEDCLRTTISIGGDCDTTAAISCAIAEAFYGIPEDMLAYIKNKLPADMKETMTKFYDLKKGKRKC